jgi:16S rRNA (guanine(966)-N(2))-methyltransferase RsmD
MPKYRRGRDLKDWQTNRAVAGSGKLRIVGGKYRGRQIAYSGDPVTRPMKDYTREAVFNLVGGWVEGKACFDLFAGTGAIGIESLSRGAVVAFLIERHFPTLRVIEENVRHIDPAMNAKVEGSDSFFWVRQFLSQPETWPVEAWVVFCCPPYVLFQEKTEELLTMIGSLIDAAPPGSILVVESNQEFELAQLPQFERWDSRYYAPAVISVLKKD